MIFDSLFIGVLVLYINFPRVVFVSPISRELPELQSRWLAPCTSIVPQDLVRWRYCQSSCNGLKWSSGHPHLDYPRFPPLCVIPPIILISLNVSSLSSCSCVS